MLITLALIGVFTLGFFCGLAGGRKEAQEVLQLKNETLEIYKCNYESMRSSYAEMLQMFNAQDDRRGATLQ